MQAGESGLRIPIDSLAGTGPQYIGTCAGATATLVVRGTFRMDDGTVPRAVVPASRVAPNNDGRTFVWTQNATDTPAGGTYQIQLVLDFGNGVIRESIVGTLFVESSP